MSCSSCGLAVTAGLSYCNRCGTDLRQKVTTRSGPSPDSLVWGIVGVTTVGLGAVIALMVIMKEVVHFSEGLINMFTLLTFLTFLLVDLLFAFLLLRSKRSLKEGANINHLQEAIRAELQAAQTAGLAEPVSIVADHTTRTLEPVPIGRKSQI
jgi:uncharacterized protein (DUF983 family)